MARPYPFFTPRTRDDLKQPPSGKGIARGWPSHCISFALHRHREVTLLTRGAPKHWPGLLRGERASSLDKDVDQGIEVGGDQASLERPRACAPISIVQAIEEAFHGGRLDGEH